MTRLRFLLVVLVVSAVSSAQAQAHHPQAAQVGTQPPAERIVFKSPPAAPEVAVVVSDRVTVTGSIVALLKRSLNNVTVEIRTPTGVLVAREKAPLQCVANCKSPFTGVTSTFRFGPVDVAPLRAGKNTIRAIATFADGSSPLVGQTVVERKTGTADLFLKALEINQGQRTVFDENPSPTQGRSTHIALSVAPAIAGRPTVVRAYPGARGAPVAGVTGLLFGTRAGRPLPGSPLRPSAPVSAKPDEPLDAQAADADRTLNFVVPPEWTRRSTEAPRLVMELNSGSLPDNEIVPECATCRNSADKIDIRTPPFLAGPAELRLIPHGTDDTPFGLSEAAMFASIARLFPIDPAAIVIEPIDSALRIRGVGCDALEQMQPSLRNTAPLGLHYAVTQDTNNPPGCLGAAYLGLPLGAGIAGGIEGDLGDATVSQELAHELGLDHAGCAHGEFSVFGCDLFPHPHGGIGNPGFDVERMLAIPPGDPAGAHTHDLLSYGGRAAPNLPLAWVSQDTWIDLRTALLDPNLNPGALVTNPRPPPPPPSAPQPPLPPSVPGRLVAFGGLDGATATFEFVFDSGLLSPGVTLEPDPREPSGEFELRALDRNGTLVDRRFFSNSADSNHTAQRPFYAVFDEAEAIVRLEMVRDGVVLAARVGSSSDPSVLWTDPPAGKVDAAAKAVNRGKRKVSWTASDADGDVLTYDVEFSRDGGRTYSVIESGITGLSSTVDLAALPSTPNGRFRVTASDGFNGATDAAAGTIAIANHAPRPFLMSPQTGAVAAAGSTVTLTGGASDVDEGALRRGLAWSSSRDGDLGTGPNVGVSRLSIGTHRLTLTATDDAKARRRVSTRVEVVPGTPDGRPPRIVRASRRGKSVTLRFSEDVLGVGPRSLRLRDARGRTLPATVTYSSRTRTATLRARRGTPARITGVGSFISDPGGQRLRAFERALR